MARSSEEIRELHFLLDDRRQEAEAARLVGGCGERGQVLGGAGGGDSLAQPATYILTVR